MRHRPFRSRPSSFPVADRAAISALTSLAAWGAAHLWVALPLLALSAFWSVFANGLPQGVDSHMHIARVAALDYSLRHGTLFPRWFPELMLGHGYPLFNYNAPLAYYVIELWHLLGASYYLAYSIASGLLVLAAGCGMYLLARAVFGPRGQWAALVAAAAYMYAPYFLTNVFVRGALSEVLAQALLPWVFWSARGLVCDVRPWRYVLPASLTLAALALAHNLTLLFVPLPWLAYVAVLWWQRGRRISALGVVVVGGTFALGLSAFFWLPVLTERSYITDTSLVVARIFLRTNGWTWRNFLDTDLAYRYSTATPFRLGLAQLGLALAGAILARRRDAEWLFWAVLALLACLGIGAWALPIWLSNPTLQAVQFPWRLLSIVSLSLALFSGGVVLRMRPGWLRVAATLGVLVLILAANGARLDRGRRFSEASSDVSAAVTAQVELDAHTLGASSLQEFRPRWASDAVALAAEPNLPAIKGDFVPDAGNAYDLRGTIASETGGPLRFSTYYFPGWRVLLDGQILPAYPSTNLGLLTVDVPAGSHRLGLSFEATRDQRIGDILTLLTLAVLVVLSGRGLSGRGWAGRSWATLLLGLLIAGVMATAWPRAQVPIRPPAEEVTGPGLRLAGYRLEPGAPASHYPYLYVYPEWFVIAPQPADWRARWGVLDSAGRVLAETVSTPWYNTSSARNWPAGTLIRDAYQVPLPPGLPAGTYQLAVQLPAPAGCTTWCRLGALTLPEPVPAELRQPGRAVEARLGDALGLAGYDVQVRGRPPAGADQLPVAHPGESVAYTLYWQAFSRVPRSYHGFVHLLDHAGRPLVQLDQLPGPIFRPALLWDTYRLQRDWYLLRIPPGTPSGLYWPSVGLYDFDTAARLPAFDAKGQPLPDGLRLPPIKIVNPASRVPERALEARFASLAALQGYDLQMPAAGLHAGQALTLTLYFKSEKTTSASYTRFVHLSSAAGILVAGVDDLPQGGANPTWSWQPGEIVADRAVLAVPSGTPPGTYRLSAGLYDPQAAGARLPVQNGKGQPWPDAEVLLSEVTVEP